MVCRFYRKFVRKQSLNVPCLSNLLKGTVWLWDKNCQEAFAKIKAELNNQNILHILDFNLPFCLHTDSSGYGLGAELFHEKEINGENVHCKIAFASRMLQKHEKFHSH